MTKKDYKVIAGIMAIYNKAMKANEENITGYKVTGSALVREITFKLAQALKADNPRFDVTKFNKACGLNN